MARTRRYSLIPELIPAPLWGRSAHQLLKGKAAWKKKIRPEAIAAADGRCQICSAHAEVLVCHDKWKYDDKALLATLIGFEVHCRPCDVVTHIGQAGQVGDPERVLTDAINTLCRVNGCDLDIAEKIIEDAFELWTKRSKKKWNVKVAPELIKRYPELEALPTFGQI